MTSELRPEFDIAAYISTACGAKHVTPRAIAIIKADREAVRAEQAAEVAELRSMLLDLLAVIHRDGGHRTQEIGRKLAWEQAMLLSSERIAELAKYKALAETLAGALPDDIDLFRIIRAAGRSNAAKAQAVYARLSEALREYKEATNV